MKSFIAPFKLLLTLIYLIYFLIFFGLISKGFIDLRTVFRPFDYVWVIFNIALGAIVSTLVVMRWWGMWNSDAEKLLETFKQRRNLYIYSTLFVILLYFLRHELANLLLYAGFSIGRFFITSSRNAYFSLLGLDMYSLRIELFAWIFQWQFVYAIFESIAKFVSKRFGKNKLST